jgi:hypothetical protein
MPRVVHLDMAFNSSVYKALQHFCAAAAGRRHQSSRVCNLQHTQRHSSQLTGLWKSGINSKKMAKRAAYKLLCSYKPNLQNFQKQKSLVWLKTKRLIVTVM